jgi:hypothetical protein
MNQEDKISQLEQLLADVKTYVNLRIDALKLRMVDHLSAFSGMLFSIIAGISLLILAMLFIMAGFTCWLAEAIHSTAGALFITGGFILGVTVLVLSWRKYIFTNRLVRFFINLFFNPAPPEKADGVKEENDEA